MAKYSTKMLHRDIKLINDRINGKSNNIYQLTKEQRPTITISWQANPKAIGDQIVVSVNNEAILLNPLFPFSIYRKPLNALINNSRLINAVSHVFEKYQKWLFDHGDTSRK